jgi:hypothetical protein
VILLGSRAESPALTELNRRFFRGRDDVVVMSKRLS